MEGIRYNARLKYKNKQATREAISYTGSIPCSRFRSDVRGLDLAPSAVAYYMEIHMNTWVISKDPLKDQKSKKMLFKKLKTHTFIYISYI